MRAATCTPVDFEADDHFFGRDTGLINRSLQGIGVDCISIMPGPRRRHEPDDLIRADSAQLVDPDWWKSLHLDFVILYAWGDPKYLPIASAIRNAGIVLIQNLDSSGISTPYADPERWWFSLRDFISGPLPRMTKMRLVFRSVRDLFPFIYERKRLAMLAEADALACVSPPALNCMADYVTALGRPKLVGKLRVIPHPAFDGMRYSGERKQNRIICVGRWAQADQHQKDPDMTLRVLHDFLATNTTWEAEIIGREASRLTCSPFWPADPEIAGRIRLTDSIPRIELSERYLVSKILLCVSRYESFHISSAEALCCGCSIVTANHPLLSSTRWFTTRNSGTTAVKRERVSIMDAIHQEVAAWDNRLRDPKRISESWIPVLSATPIARSLVDTYTSILPSKPI